MNDETTITFNPPRRDPRSWIYGLLLILILTAGAYLRFVGLRWDEDQHLHPDERFLTMVESAIQPIGTPQDALGPPPTLVSQSWRAPYLNDLPDCEQWGGYFDTACSPLNPHNRGHTFFVYGSLPIFIVRYVAEGVDLSGYGDVHVVGRFLSALADLGVILLVYGIAKKIYDRRVGLMAAGFAAFSVLPIQLSHFFTVDTFSNLFALLSVYFAIQIAVIKPNIEEMGFEQSFPKLRNFFTHPFFTPSIFFGLALGMAMASKINVAPVAFTLPLAALLYGWRLPVDQRRELAPILFAYLILAAGISLIAFRIFQPYAFIGPGFFGIKLNPAWLENMKSVSALTGGDVDFPPALQWARRPYWFSLDNIIRWGLGLPLGILAWFGFLLAGWRMLKGDWLKHILLWGWTAFYFFGLQSFQWNSTMRYQLPIYPLLAIFGAWSSFYIYDRQPSRFRRSLVAVLGMLIVLASAAWSYGFTDIYRQAHPRIAASRWIFQNLPGPITLAVDTDQGEKFQPIPFHEGTLIIDNVPYNANFTASVDGTISGVELLNIADQSSLGGVGILTLKLTSPSGDQSLASLESDFAIASPNKSGGSYNVELDQPFRIYAGENYVLQLAYSGAGELTLAGTAIANESTWDDGLPLRIDGYDPYGGIYQNGLNFEMYWDDNQEKFERFISTLNQADYILITSSRQWASTTRVPARYPLTIEYYRNLLNCPVENTIEWCYNVAEPGMFQGDLGFELIQVFQSSPTIGAFSINDQASEEAFTVYDHPKVFIFKKMADYDPDRVMTIMGAVDLTKVIRITPRKADDHPGTLMLPYDRLDEQRTGGTWSDLFDVNALYNSYPILGVILWYLSVFTLGLIVYPLMRYTMPGLVDRGYPLARIVGLLLLSYGVWLAGSLRIPFSRGTIAVVLLLLLTINGYLAYRQREALVVVWREQRVYFLVIEGLFLAFFLTGLWVRFGNPDLWHPWKGGEKPMDFSYFNAVLKSTSFPPYDPWFAGGYINYYYFGFVFVGVLVKFLGIVPAFAYNLILPTIFAMIALGVFSIVWNLVDGKLEAWQLTLRKLISTHRFSSAMAGALGMAVLGNLGIFQMFVRGYQRLIVPIEEVTAAGVVQRTLWAVQGFFKSLSGMSLSYRLDEWYWNPSRVISTEHGGPITEFPFFTFLYGDLHAHWIALPITILAVAWALSWVLGRGINLAKPARIFGSLMIGALVVGALYPTNTWDYYPYLLLGCVGISYTAWIWHQGTILKRLFLAVGGSVFFIAAASKLYQPYRSWYGQGYNQIDIWGGTNTPSLEYLAHWGLFLFLIVSWLFIETIDWMRTTPVSALRKLQPYRGLIVAAFSVVLLVIFNLGLSFGNQASLLNKLPIGLGMHIVWWVLPLAIWTVILIFRPGLSHQKRIVLFFIGTALALTLLVEIIVLRGDIGRMNTVFKFYLQAWTFFAISAAASLGWLFAEWQRWHPGRRLIWQIALSLLVVVAGLYPFMAGYAKTKDRMEPSASRSLDGMVYMEDALHHEEGSTLDLSQDYRAIRWIQDNVSGSPVIVEANQVEYHWGTRFTVYTGLPGVVGWNWHQRQQRTLTPHEWVFERVDAVHEFYMTEDLALAEQFLDQYQVSYIIYGLLEQAKYAGPGLDKFSSQEGTLWDEVFRTGETIIYRVLENYP
ncbi:MAG: DUF2298 domain-containing protein [Chloroflexota bacterium]